MAEHPGEAEAAAPLAPIRLTPVRPEHAALCWRWRHEPHARQFNPYDDLTLDELAERFGSVGCDLRNQSFKIYRWLVQIEGSGPIGTVSIRANWRMLHGEVGYQISEQWGGLGYGTAAVAALVDMAFGESEMVRLFATISVGNETSRRLAQRLGFRHEGTLRSHHLIESRFVDQWVYGLLREDWRSHSESAAGNR